MKASYLLQTDHPRSSHPSPYRKLLQSKSQLSSLKVYKVISSLQFARPIQRSLHMEINKQPISYNECGSLTCVALWLILLPAQTASLSPVPTISPTQPISMCRLFCRCSPGDQLKSNWALTHFLVPYWSANILLSCHKNAVATRSKVPCKDFYCCPCFFVVVFLIRTSGQNYILQNI